MVETIAPVVHGGRRARWALDVALHVVGATLAAAVFGALLGGIGTLLGAPFGAAGLLLLAAVAVVYGVAEAARLGVPIPQARRQVPDWWRTFFSMPVFSFLYGAGLGVGFLTYLSRGTLIAVTAACVASGRPLTGLVSMAPFGFARSAVVLLAAGATTREAAAALVDRLAEASRSVWWRIANGAVLFAVALTAGLTALDTGGDGAGLERLLPAALAALFGWAGFAKLLRPRAWRRSLTDHRFPRRVASVAGFGVPFAELAVAALAVLGYGRAAGVAAAILTVVFSAAVLRARGFAEGQVPCGCFGGVRSRDWRVLVLRNLAVLALSIATALTGSDPRIEWPGTPSGSEVLPALLAVAGVLVGGWVLVTAANAFRAGKRRQA
ncbi:MAG: MauE/DoxX family redox-associated membrane protein [Actinomycetota bacterium]